MTIGFDSILISRIDASTSSTIPNDRLPSSTSSGSSRQFLTIAKRLAVGRRNKFPTLVRIGGSTNTRAHSLPPSFFHIRRPFWFNLCDRDFKKIGIIVSVVESVPSHSPPVNENRNRRQIRDETKRMRDPIVQQQIDRIAYLQIVPPDELYNYSFAFPFEEEFTAAPSTCWMQDNWRVSITLSIVYALSIYVGQRLMSRRQAFQLDTPLFVWNAALALFSIIGTVRFAPEFVYVLTTHGFRYTMCTSGYAQTWVTGFWTEMFAWSKAVELIDTLFIVLRKRPLIFLHWYHHITVMIYTWHAYKDHTAGGRWFIMMNYTVHAFMYSYYALRSRGWRFPKWIPMTVTCMQLSQMVVGCAIAIVAYRTKLNGEFCQQTFENLYFSAGIYSTYFILFAKFFYDVYLKKGNRYQMHQKKIRDAETPTTKKQQHQNGIVQNGHHHTNGHSQHQYSNGVEKKGEMNGHAVKNGHSTTELIGNGHHHQNGVADGIANGVSNGTSSPTKQQQQLHKKVQ